MAFNLPERHLRHLTLIDRVIHHADVLVIEGESYRLREAEKRAGKRADGTKRT